MILRYIDGEYGTNELYKYRVIGIFEHMKLLHKLVYEVARSMLKERGLYSENVEHYLTELHDFSLKRKTHPLETGEDDKGTYHYDFVALMESNFLLDSFELR